MRVGGLLEWDQHFTPNLNHLMRVGGLLECDQHFAPNLNHLTRVGDLLVWDQHFMPSLTHFVSHVMSAVHVHEVEEAFVTPRVSTDGGLFPADGAALRARVFPSPWCSVCGVELMSAGVLRQLIFCCTFQLHPRVKTRAG